MDSDLQYLKKLARGGDPQAAIAYIQQLSRLGQAIKEPLPVEESQVSLHQRRISGVIIIRPISLTEIRISQQWEDNSVHSGQNRIPITINNVDYNIDARYYYYPDQGWLPFSPQTVAHAKQHYDRNRESAFAQQRDWTWYLPRPWQTTNVCMFCERSDLYVVSELHLRRSSNANLTRLGRDGSPKAVENLDNYLRTLIPAWVADHQNLMRAAQLNTLQNSKVKLFEKLEELSQKMTDVQNQLAEMVIEELQIEY